MEGLPLDVVCGIVASERWSGRCSSTIPESFWDLGNSNYSKVVVEVFYY